MKAFIKVSTGCQGWEVYYREIILRVANKWNWVAPTCMNVVKHHVVFPFTYSKIYFFFIFKYLFFFLIAVLVWYRDYELSHNHFSTIKKGFDEKYRLLYILYCILFTMLLYKKVHTYKEYMKQCLLLSILYFVGTAMFGSICWIFWSEFVTCFVWCLYRS